MSATRRLGRVTCLPPGRSPRADIYGRFQVLTTEHALFLPAFVRETIHVSRSQVQDVQLDRRGHDAYFAGMWLKR